jgi:hypothetical protein
MKKNLFLIAFLLLNFQLLAQDLDSLKYLNALHRQKNNAVKFIAPTTFVLYGAISLGESQIRDLDISTKDEIIEDHPNFIAHADDYLKFVPLTAVFGLDLIGVKAKHNAVDQTAIMFITMGINMTVVTELKKITSRLRPDGSSFNSFPSGHTATAFAAAEFLNLEFRDVSRWYGYGGYLVAAATGVLRVYNNRHWVSDVVAGAGFGILSTKLTYFIYPHVKRILAPLFKKNLFMSPSYQQGLAVLNLKWKLE